MENKIIKYKKFSNKQEKTYNLNYPCGQYYYLKDAIIKPLLVLKVTMIQELKCLAYPPQSIPWIFNLILKILNNKTQDYSWQASRVELNDRNFLQNIVKVDPSQLSRNVLQVLRKSYSDEQFERLKSQSIAGFYLGQWVKKSIFIPFELNKLRYISIIYAAKDQLQFFLRRDQLVKEIIENYFA